MNTLLPKINNPASPAAVLLGCTCCAEANHGGAGEPINEGANTRHYIRLYCPVHSAFQRP